MTGTTAEAADFGTAGTATRKQTVAVLGPGGVGGLIAGLLVRAGYRVVCVAGEQTAEILRDRGLSVRSAQFGDFTVPVAADTELREPVAACIVAPKETSLVAALDRVPPEALGEGLVLPLLNGFEHVALLRERYGAGLVVPGTIRVESTRTAPGVIEHASPFAMIDLASRTAPAARVTALGALLADAGAAVTVRQPADEDQMLWEKFALLLPIALLTTRYATPIGEVRTAHHDELLAVIRELAQVGQAVGVRIDAEKVAGVVDMAPATLRSSMQRDASAGRPMELDALGGALLRAAARHSLAAPVTARLVTELGG